MADMPDEVAGIIVDDVYDSYSILYDEETGDVHFECETCDDIVASTSFDVVASMDEMELYEYIVTNHEPL